MDNSQFSHWTDDPDLLDRYVLERVEPSERALLEQHLRACGRCRRVVQDERELLAGITLSGREKMKELLRESLKSEEANVFQRYQFISLAAAVLVILVGLGVFRYYVGSIEWPVKFSSRTYIVKQGARDSSATSERKDELSASQADKPMAREPRQDQTPQAGNPPGGNLAGAGASARGESASGSSDNVQNEVEHDRNPEAFWLLGTVTMTPETNGQIHLSAQTENERKKGMEKKFFGQSRVFRIRKDGVSQTITLRQRSSELLPPGKGKQGVDDRIIQTLVQKTSQGLNLTFYRDKPFQRSQIQQATIEPVTKDSLIIILANERIAYRIPGDGVLSSR